MSASKKTCYHSELVKLGAIPVKINSDVQKSKFYGNPDYCILLIDGQERNYTVESPQCAALLRANKGRNVMLQADGSREDATLTIIAAGAAPEPQQRQAQPPQQHDSNPPGRPGGGQARQEQPQQEQVQNRKRTPMGQTVGMAINNACANLTARGLPLNPKDIAATASDLLRLSYWLEEGNLLPTFEHRAKSAEAQRLAAEQAEAEARAKQQAAAQPAPAGAAEPPPVDQYSDVPFN